MTRDVRGEARSLLVTCDGKPVRQSQRGCDASSLFYTFSVSKPFTAFAVHQLVDHGELNLDERVGHYWPGYGVNGKRDITVRQVLTHRAGVPFSSGRMASDALAMHDWDRSVTLAEKARPRWAPGSTLAYHVLSFGFILGELVRRVSGMGIPEYLNCEVFQPLGMTDTYLGLPDGQRSRAIALATSYTWARPRAWLFNSSRVRGAVVPAAGLMTTGADLALFYEMLSCEGATKHGAQLLQPAALARALEVTADAELDRVVGHPMRYSAGFQLGGLPGVAQPFGRSSSPQTFGHNGSNSCTTWADPTRRLVFVRLTNIIERRSHALERASDESDSVLDAYNSGKLHPLAPNR